jgi:hypothetical protein
LRATWRRCGWRFNGQIQLFKGVLGLFKQRLSLKFQAKWLGLTRVSLLVSATPGFTASEQVIRQKSHFAISSLFLNQRGIFQSHNLC